jgi:zinc ribbon protein
MQSQKPPRPLGVTVIAILAILGGILGMLAGLLIVGVSTLLASPFGAASGALVGLGAIVGGAFIVVSLIWVAAGFGLLHGKGWAWALEMLVNVLLVIGAIAFTALGNYSSVIGIVLPGLMIWYLTRTRVKAFFGKASWTPTPAFAPSPSFSTPSLSTPSLGTTTSPSFGSNISPTGTTTSTPTLARFCTHCGATISPSSTKCTACGANL